VDGDRGKLEDSSCPPYQRHVREISHCHSYHISPTSFPFAKKRLFQKISRFPNSLMIRDARTNARGNHPNALLGMPKENVQALHRIDLSFRSWCV
jgi:hypothetical protein